MKKTIYSRFDKAVIADLPVITFPGRIITINTLGEAEKAVDYLLESDILGVDTETKPIFHKGEQHKVALLQVSNRTTCFLFRLCLIGITPSIKRLLEDVTVRKIGLSWHDDIHSLMGRETFKPGLFIDLQDLVGDLGVKDLSLQKLFANFFRKKISKRQRLSNWEAKILDDKQKQYAAIDAWSCILLYEEIMRLERTHDYELVVVPDSESELADRPTPPQAPPEEATPKKTTTGKQKKKNSQADKARNRKRQKEK